MCHVSLLLAQWSVMSLSLLYHLPSSPPTKHPWPPRIQYVLCNIAIHGQGHRHNEVNGNNGILAKRRTDEKWNVKESGLKAMAAMPIIATRSNKAGDIK